MKTFPLVYITIPEELQKKIFGRINFTLNPAIPIPVELPFGNGGHEEDFLNIKENLEEKIKIEMILSGLLQHLAKKSGALPVKKAAEKNLHDSATGEGSSNYYRKLIFAIKPSIANELHEAAIIKAGNGDYKTALKILDLLFGLQGTNPHLLLNRALIIEADAASERRLKFNSGTTAKANEIAQAVEMAEAVEIAYEKALANPAPDTLFYAALFYEKQDNFSKSASCLESYLDSFLEDEELDGEDSKYIKARELLAEIRNNGLDDMAFSEAINLIRNGNEKEGINKARDFLERHPEAGRGWFVLGWGLRCLLNWDHAFECFKKALELGCVNADTYNELAICLLEKGELTAAERELEKALSLEPENVKIISNMGLLAVKQGSNEKAAAFFRTVLELEPNDPVARSFLV